MNYRISGDRWASVFAVPACVSDEFLRLAGGSALKVLLFMLRNPGAEIPEIALAAGISGETVREALTFWTETNVLVPAENTENTRDIKSPMPKINAETGETAGEKKPKLPSGSNGYIKNPSEISEREKSSRDIAALLSMAQSVFSTCITYPQQGSLIWMYEYLGLPAEVILTLVNYCVSINKPHFRYIETVALKWAEAGINSLEAADTEVSRLETSRSLLGKTLELLGQSGRATSKQREIIDNWAARGVPFELVEYAYEKTAGRKNGTSIPYINGVIENWHKNGLSSPDEVRKWEGDNPFVYDGKDKKEPKAGEGQSYDISALDTFFVN